MDRSKITLTVAGVLFFFTPYHPQPVWPLYIKQEGFGIGAVGLLLSLYPLALIISRIPIGVLADRLVGKRRLLISLGFALMAFGSILPPVIGGLAGIIASRLILGLGAGFYVAFAIIYSSYFPATSLRRSIMVAAAFFGLGQLVATPSGGFLGETVDILAPFWTSAAAALLGAFLSFSIREPELAPIKGAVLLKNSQLYLASFLMMIIFFTVYATVYSLSQIFAEDLGATKVDQGLLLFTYLAVFCLITLLVAPSLSDKIGLPLTILLGMGFVGLGAGLVPTSTMVTLYASEALIGLGLGLSFGLLMAMSVENVSEGQRFSAMGIFQFAYAIGIFAGPAVGAQIADGFSTAAAFYTSVAVIAFGAAVLLAYMQLERIHKQIGISVAEKLP